MNPNESQKMTEMHSAARESIIALMERAGNPLTEAQQITLAGALAVWITKAQRDMLEEVARYAIRHQRYETALNEIAKHTGRDDPCRALVNIARVALKN